MYLDSHDFTASELKFIHSNKHIRKKQHILRQHNHCCNVTVMVH